jgi:hypothetical protein
MSTVCDREMVLVYCPRSGSKGLSRTVVIGLRGL